MNCVADVDTLHMHIHNHMRDGRDAPEADLHVLGIQIAIQEPLSAGERAYVTPGEVSKVVPRIKSRGQ